MKKPTSPICYSQEQFNKSFRLLGKPQQNHSYLQQEYIQIQSKYVYRAYIYQLGSLTNKQKQNIQRQIQQYANINLKRLTPIEAFTFVKSKSNNQLILLNKKLKQYTNLFDLIDRNRAVQQQKPFLDQLQSLIHAINEIYRHELVHSKITLKNTFFHKNYIVLGLPLFRSITKTQAQNIDTKKQPKKKDIYKETNFFEGYRPCFETDEWALIVVMLQLALNQVLQDKIDSKSLLKVVEESIMKIEKTRILQRLKTLFHSILQKYLTRNSSQQLKQSLCCCQYDFFTIKRFIPMSIQFPFEKYRSHSKMSVNHLKIAQIINKTEQKMKIICYQNHNKPSIILISIEMLSFGLINNNSLRFIITRQVIEQNFWYVCSDIKYLKQMIVISKLYVSDQGNLVILVSKKQKKDIRQRYLKQKKQKQDQLKLKLSSLQTPIPQSLKYFNGCSIKITNQIGEKFDGFLIGRNFILTSAQTICNKVTGNQTKIASLQYLYKNLIHYNLIINIQYKIAKTTQQPQQDYILLYLSSDSIIKRQYITISYDYNQLITVKKLSQSKQTATFHYQLGYHMTLRSQQIQFNLQIDLFYIKTEFSNEVRPGCPLLVVLSNNHVYAIGLIKGRRRGFLFNQNFMYQIWRLISNYQISKTSYYPDYITFRTIKWQEVCIEYPQAPLIINNNYIFDQIDDECDYFCPTKKISRKQRQQINSLPFKLEAIRNLAFSQKMNKIYFSKAIELKLIIQKYYGPNNDRIDILTYFILFNQYNQKGVLTNEVLDLINQYNLKTKKKNILFHLEIVGLIIKIIKKDKCLNQMRYKYLDENIELVERMNYNLYKLFFFTENFNKYCEQNDKINAQIYQIKAAEAAYHQKKYQKLFKLLIFQFSYLTQLRNIKHLLWSLETAFKIIKSSKKNINKYQYTFKKYWRDLCKTLLTSTSVTVDDVDKFILITRTHLQDEIQVIPIFQTLKQRKQRSIKQ